MDSLSIPELDLASLLANGQEPSLSALGGMDALNPYLDQIRRSRLVDEFVRAAVNETHLSDHVLDPISTFVASLVEGLTDEFALPVVVDVLDDANWIDAACAEKCAASFRSLILDRGASAIARAFALDGAYRIGIDRASTRFELYGVLLRIQVDDDPVFLCRALKVLGVSYASEGLPALLDHIVTLSKVEAIRGEAAFEIGLIKLAVAFDAKGVSDARQAFHDSAYWFQKADEITDASPEAKLYASCLGVLATFADSKDVAMIAELTETVKSCCVMLAAWHYDASDPAWLGSRKFQMVCWESLALQLQRSAEALSQDFWPEPIVVIEQHILPLFISTRTVFKRTGTGGLEAVIRPRIEAALVTERVRSRALIHWLSTNAEHEWRAAAEDLSRAVLTVFEAADDPVLSRAATQLPTVAALVHDSVIPDEAKRRVAQVLDDTRSLQLSNIKANVDAIVAQCIEAVEEYPDYKLNPDARALFGGILLWSVLFLSDRLDATIQNSPSVAYLFL